MDRDFINSPLDGNQFVADESNGKIISAVAYGGYNGAMVEATIAIDTLRREMLWYMFYYPFEQMKVRKIIARIESNNDKSLNLVKRLGFIEECVLKECAPDGDLFIYSISKDKWLDRGNTRKSQKEKL